MEIGKWAVTQSSFLYRIRLSMRAYWKEPCLLDMEWQNLICDVKMHTLAWCRNISMHLDSFLKLLRALRFFTQLNLQSTHKKKCIVVNTINKKNYLTCIVKNQIHFLGLIKHLWWSFHENSWWISVNWFISVVWLSSECNSVQISPYLFKFAISL